MTEIRSFRRVFDLERRIYAVDRLRLNPAGVPVRGIVYLLCIVVLALAASAMPVSGAAVRLLPWYLRELALPAAIATVLAAIRIDGRTSHVAIWAQVRFLLEPRRLSGLIARSTVGCRWRPPDIAMLPDGSDHDLRALRYTGPGAVLVSVAHRRCRIPRRPIGRRSELRIERPDDESERMRAVGSVIEIPAGATVVVGSDRAGRRR